MYQRQVSKRPRSVDSIISESVRPVLSGPPSRIRLLVNACGSPPAFAAHARVRTRLASRPSSIQFVTGTGTPLSNTDSRPPYEEVTTSNGSHSRPGADG